MKYYRGKFYRDYDREFLTRHGWLIGRFVDGMRKRREVEIKLWKFKKGEKTSHERKRQKRALECTFILKGKVSGEINGKRVVLSRGEYVVLPPLLPSNFPTKILERTEGLTIKAPSRKRDAQKFKDGKWISV
jgi:hypothetical protein